jgi:hypothetical protein
MENTEVESRNLSLEQFGKSVPCDPIEMSQMEVGVRESREKKENTEKEKEKMDYTSSPISRHKLGRSDRYFSIKATMNRLSKLPHDVLNAFNTVNIGANFRVFVSEIEKRNYQLIKSQGVYSTLRMWTGNVYFFCYKFYIKHFQKSSDISEVPINIIEYIRTSPIIDMLQVFIDISQRNRYIARNQLKELANSNISRTMNYKRELIRSKIRCRTLGNLYYDFVELYKKCTGCRIPKRIVRNAIRSNKNYNSNRKISRSNWYRKKTYPTFFKKGHLFRESYMQKYY